MTATSPSHAVRDDRWRHPRRAVAVLTLLAAFGLVTLEGRQQPARLTVERIAALPSFIGTAPASPVWSPDSTRVAFLWNDQGMPFRDVWMVAAGDGEPSRLTRFAPAESSLPAEDTSLEALTARAAARARGGVSDLVWSPDGRSLVVSYQGDLHRVGVDGAAPTRLTRNGGGKSQLAFSPDGRLLSFLQGGDLWLWHVATETLVRATDVGVPPIGTTPGGSFFANDVEFRTPVWSPDSKHVALTYEDRRGVRQVPFPDYIGEETTMNLARRGYPGDPGAPRAVAVYTVADGIARFIDLPERTSRSVIEYAWSPDGAHLLVEQDSDDAETRWLSVVRTSDRSVRELLRDHRERRMYSIFTSTWRSDGQAVLFIDDTAGHYRLSSLPLSGGPATILTPGAFDVASERGATPLHSSRTRQEVFFVSSQKSPYERQVYRVPERGGAVTQVTSLEGVHWPDVSPDGSKIAVLHSSDISPTELYVRNVVGGVERRVTHSPPKEFDTYTWSKPRYVTFKSRIDGFTLHGRLVLPPNLDPSRKYPVVLGSVYNNTVRNEWRGLNQTLQQFMAREGQYINLQVDLRGSVGHGVAFREAFQGDWGGAEISKTCTARSTI